MIDSFRADRCGSNACLTGCQWFQVQRKYHQVFFLSHCFASFCEMIIILYCSYEVVSDISELYYMIENSCTPVNVAAEIF